MQRFVYPYSGLSPTTQIIIIQFLPHTCFHICQRSDVFTNLFHPRRNQAKVRIVRRINITNTCFYSYSLSAWTDSETDSKDLKLHEFTPQELHNLRQAMKESKQVFISKTLEEINKELDHHMWTGVKSVRMKEFLGLLKTKRKFGNINTFN